MPVPNAVITIQGDVIVCGNINRVNLNKNKLTITHNDNSQTEYTYDSPALAATDYGLWVVTLGAVGMTPSSLVWTSITPSTMSAGLDSQVYDIVGTGFIQFLADNLVLKLDNGTPAQTILTTAGPNSDTLIQFITDPTPMFASTYTLYYSIDSGSNWTTTGLTVTVT